MQAPTDMHLQAAKRVFHYIKETIDHGLHLVRDSSFHLNAFCDSDWASDSSDRKSTTAYVIYNGSNPIS